jgi:ferric-dicitrate binding protein FerR (iron transport regulator)
MRILELKSFLRKYREQKITKDEHILLANLLEDDTNEALIKETLIDEIELFKNSEPQIPADFRKIFDNITSRIESNIQEKKLLTGTKRPFFRILRIAVAMVLLFAAGSLFSFFIFNRAPERIPVSYSEIKAPLGARSEIRLPDGSTVWLNAGSKIRYQNVFNKENRFISLEGEAYFKVAKNPDLPFNVKTGGLNIVAIGTEFNVKAYNDEGIIETTLVEGKVSIKHDQKAFKKSETVVLEAHQKAVFVKENQQLTIEDLKSVKQIKPGIIKLKKGNIYIAEKIDPVPTVSWKDNRLIFKGEELSNLLIKLERKYDVSFSFEYEEIKQFRFTGTLEDETLTQVLDVIKLSAPIDYKLDGKTVRILENKQMTKKFSGHLKKK